MVFKDSEHWKVAKLITALRTAVEKDDGPLD